MGRAGQARQVWQLKRLGPENSGPASSSYSPVRVSLRQTCKNIYPQIGYARDTTDPQWHTVEEHR